MSIDLSEPIAAGHHVIEVVRRHAGESVDGAIDAARGARRDVERTVGRKAKRAQTRAERVLASRQSQRTGPRAILAIVLAGGLAVGVATLIVRRMRSDSPATDASGFKSSETVRDAKAVPDDNGAVSTAIAP